jgi:hypothetical protein
MIFATVNFLLYDMGRDAGAEFDPPARERPRARSVLEAPFDGGLVQVKDESAS